ncbi:MAG: SagB/ThcOx family dehydrogenase [Promethearchaeota archaeon]
MDSNSNNYGDNFQQQSKYVRNHLPAHFLDWNSKPKIYKSYKNPINIIHLPTPKFDEKISFWKIIKNRQSLRKFNREPLNLEQISSLLFGMSGITRKYTQFAFRTVPSAGGLFPIETYCIVNNVIDVDLGVYHYNIKEHVLECLKLGDYRNDAMKASLDQKMVYNSPITFIWTAIIERSKWKYLQRCYRYIYMDAGHVGQNFYLVAEALGLAACTIGAIYDNELNDLLEIDGIEETAIYVGVTGNKKIRK